MTKTEERIIKTIEGYALLWETKARFNNNREYNYTKSVAARQLAREVRAVIEAADFDREYDNGVEAPFDPCNRCNRPTCYKCPYASGAI